MASAGAKIRFADPPADVSLKSLGLAALSFIIDALADDTADPALQPVISEIAEYASTLPPGALFDDISPATGRHAVPLLVDGSYNPDTHLRSAVDGGTAIASASSTKSEKNNAATALSGDNDGWQSSSDAAASWWQMQLAAPTYVQAVDLRWRTMGQLRAVPESFTVSVSEDGTTWTQVGPAIAPDALPKTAMAAHVVAVDAVARFVKVDAKGYCKNTPAEQEGKPGAAVVLKERGHALAQVRLLVPDTLSVHVAPGHTLFDLEKLLYDAAIRSPDATTVANAVRGLERLSLASGSAQGLLRLVTALVALQAPPAGFDAAGVPAKLRAPDAPRAAITMAALPAEPAAGSSSSSSSSSSTGSFARGLDEAANEELEALLLPVKLTGDDAGGSSKAPTPAFDPGCMSVGVELSEDNTVMRSTQSRTAVYGTHGFSKGVVAWEFKSLIDNMNDEYLCFGCGTKPRTSDAYDSSNDCLYMIRAYNGCVYQKGSSGRSIEKIHQNDTVRFELDCEAGTVRAIVRGTDCGVVFDRDLKGKEVFPAVCTYNSGKSAKFTKLEIVSGGGASSGGGAANDSAGRRLVQLAVLASGDEDATPASTGHYFSAGQLEEGEGEGGSGDDSGPRIIVAGVRRAAGLSLRPDAAANTESSVTFPLAIMKPGEAGGKDGKDKGKKDAAKDKDKLHKPFEYLVASVGVDDSSRAPSAASSSSSSASSSGATKVAPVVYVFEADGKTVYTSPPLSAPGETHFLRVPVAGAASLRIVARLAPGAPSGAHAVAAKAVICDARVIEVRDWTWSSRRTGGLPGFVDAPAAAAAGGAGAAASPSSAAAAAMVSGGDVAVPRSPLSMARFVLSRLAFLAEAQNEVTRRGLAAAAKVQRITGVGAAGAPAAAGGAGADAGGSGAGAVGVDALIFAGEAAIAAAAAAKKPAAGATKKDEKDGKDKKEEPGADEANTVLPGDIFALQGLRRMQSRLCLDVSAGTLTALRRLLHALLPLAHAENGDLVPAAPGAAPAGAYPSGVLSDAEEAALAAARPYTAAARHVLALIKAHLRRLVASQVDPAIVGIRVASGTAAAAPAGGAGGAAAAAASPAAGGAGSASALVASVAASVAERGDVASTITRTASGAGALTSLPRRRANPLASAAAGAAGLAVSPAAVAALAARFAAGSNAAPAAGAESTLAPLHRLLQAIVEDEDPVVAAGRPGRGGAEGDEEAEEEEGAEAEAGESAAPGAAVVRSRLTPPVQSAAADAIDAGLAVLYPSQSERRQLLAGLIARGGTVEVQFRFPATRSDGAGAAAAALAAADKDGGKDKKDDKDKKGKEDKDKKGKDDKDAAAKEKEREEALKRKLARDPRPDRALILLQLECQRAGLPCHVYGAWGHYMHVVIRLGSGAAAATAAAGAAGGAAAAPAPAAVDFLDAGFARVFARAGLGRWTIPTGCGEPSIPLKITRVADFGAPDRLFADGIGLVRIFPRAAGSFASIDAGVRAQVASYTKGAAAAGAGAGAGAGPAAASLAAGGTSIGAAAAAAAAAKSKKRVISTAR